MKVFSFIRKLSTPLKKCAVLILIVTNLLAGFPLDNILQQVNGILLSPQLEYLLFRFSTPQHTFQALDFHFPKTIHDAKALSTVYDFSVCGITCDTSTTWWASDDGVDIFPFANTAANRNDHTENLDADYTALSSSNDTRFVSQTAPAGDEIFLWFEMDISEDPTDIAQIDFTYEGSPSITANFSVWVKDDTTSYENDIAWIRVGTVQSITAATETSFTRTLSGVDFSNYIDANGMITWAVTESVAAVAVTTDYVGITVTTNTVEQEGYRWRFDNGSETTATWQASQDSNITQATATNTRLRTVLNDTAEGDQATTQYQLEYKLSTDTVYRPVEASSGSIAWGSTGTASGNQSTVLQVTAPATVNRGDLLVMGLANKYPTNGPTTPTGWTAITNNQASGGAGASGADTGSVYSTIFVREAEGWEDSVVFSVNIPSANSSEAQIQRFTKGTGKKWDLAATTGSDTSQDTSWSAAGAANPGITAGDIMFSNIASNTDGAAWGTYGFSATGLTIGTQSERNETASTAGDQLELIQVTHIVSSGTASSAPTMTASPSVAAAGSMVFLRIRQVDAPIQLAASTNITASGEATTAQLVAPVSIPTFVAGRMMDDENPADTIDINNSQYTEMEWCMTATSQAATSDVYQFRVTANGLVLTTYTVTPQWTIGTPSADAQQIAYRWRADDGPESGGNTPTWYNASWGYRKSIVIDAADVAGSADLTNFPVLINLTSNDFKSTGNGGYVGLTTGYDILFTSSNGTTKLDHEIDYYSPTTGQIIMWVEVPTLDYNDNTTIYIYYGNAGAADQQNPTGTWNSSFAAIYHLQEDPSVSTDGDCGGGTKEVCDSTSNNNDADSAGTMTSGDLVTGKVASAIDFDGTNDSLDVADGASLDLASSWALSAWFQTRDQTGYHDIVTKTDGGASSGNYYLETTTDEFESGFWNGSTYSTDTTTAANVATSTWYHVVAVFDDTGNTLTTYVNGTQSHQTTSVTATPSTNNFLLHIGSGYSNEEFDGIIDEVHVANTTLSADWIQTEYNNQNDPSTAGFLSSVGTQESYSSGSGASWAAAENTALTGVSKNTNYRIRLEISNESNGSTGAQTYQLQVAETGTCSSGTYAAVPTDSSGDWKIAATAQYTDGTATTNVASGLTDYATTFVAGEVKDTGNTTGSITLAGDNFTEIEFSVQATINATDAGTYCFRVNNINTYTRYAQATLAAGPTFTLSTYRWYNDSNNENVTDVWGNPDLAENTAISLTPATNAAPTVNTELRLRVALTVGTAALSSSVKQFTLEYKAGTDGSCTSGSWTAVGAGGGGSIWRYATSSVTDGTTLTVAKLTPSDVLQVYVKASPSTANPNTATVGQDIEYDFHIEHNGALDAKTYSFRVVNSDNTTLSSYTYCPTLVTAPETSQLLRHGKVFSEETKQGFQWVN